MIDFGQRVFNIARHGEQRMNHQLHTDPLTIDFHADRIDQKRHVVIDEFDYRDRCFPAVVGAFRIENPHLRRTTRKRCAKGEMRKCQARPSRGFACHQVVGVNLIAIFRSKRFRVCALCDGRF